MDGRAGRKWVSPKITVGVLIEAKDAGLTVREVAAKHGWRGSSVRNACARHKILLKGMGTQPGKASKGAVKAPELPPLLPINHRNADPVACSALWKAVLLEQLRLALTVGAYGGDGGVGYSNPIEQARARDWFGSKDFYMTCALAGLEGDAVLQGYQRQLTKSKQQEVARAEALAAGAPFQPWGPAFHERRIT